MNSQMLLTRLRREPSTTLYQSPLIPVFEEAKKLDPIVLDLSFESFRKRLEKQIDTIKINDVYDNIVSEIADFIDQHPVEELNLSDHELTVDEVKRLAQTFKTNHTLKKLDLSGMDLSGTQISIILDALIKNQQLQLENLNLSNNSEEQDYDEMINLLAVLLAKDKHLQSLNLQGIYPKNCYGFFIHYDALFFAATYNTTLLKLWISSKGLGDVEFHGLCSMLSNNHTLKELYLDVRLGDSQPEFFQQLTHNRGLQVLSFRGELHGHLALKEVLSKHNHTLCEIHCDQPIPEVIAALLHRNQRHLKNWQRISVAISFARNCSSMFSRSILPVVDAEIMPLLKSDEKSNRLRWMID